MSSNPCKHVVKTLFSLILSRFSYVHFAHQFNWFCIVFACAVAFFLLLISMCNSVNFRNDKMSTAFDDFHGKPIKFIDWQCIRVYLVAFEKCTIFQFQNSISQWETNDNYKDDWLQIQARQKTKQRQNKTCL